VLAQLEKTAQTGAGEVREVSWQQDMTYCSDTRGGMHPRLKIHGCPFQTDKRGLRGPVANSGAIGAKRGMP
jgi:hypothetical protein